MARYVIDAPAALRIVRDGLEVRHDLVAPSVLRSQALALVYASVRTGETSRSDALQQLDAITTMRIRLLGDRVSRGTAFRLALEHDWADTAHAEYIAVTRLQADAIVALDPRLAAAATGIVPVADFAELAAHPA
jgi:hypothetical protein